MPPSQLVAVEGFPIQVHASRGAEAHAREVAALVLDARGWLAKVLAAEEPLTSLKVLAAEDWNDHCPVPVFGVPYEDQGRGVILGHGRAEFATESMERAEPYLGAGERTALATMFGEPADLTPYLDQVAVHEVAHGMQIQQGWSFARFWLYELFPQLAMVGYTATHRPERLPILDLVHDVSGTLPLDALPRSELAGMETSFEHGAWLYAWYEFRLGALARRMWDLAGEDALRGLFQGFRDADMDDGDILRAMSGIHPAFPDLLEAWPYPEKARVVRPS